MSIPDREQLIRGVADDQKLRNRGMCAPEIRSVLDALDRLGFSIITTGDAGRSVHDEPDFARVYDDDEPVQVRRGDLQALLDLATGSMDFGSGFWDEEQAEIAQNIARLLGIDPKVVTPSNQVCRYFGHTWGWQTWRDWRGYGDRWLSSYRCRFCNRIADSVTEIIHTSEPDVVAAPLPPPDRWEGLTRPGGAASERTNPQEDTE